MKIRFVKIAKCKERPEFVGLIIGIMENNFKNKSPSKKAKQPSLRELILSNREMIISLRTEMNGRFDGIDKRIDNLVKKNNLTE